MKKIILSSLVIVLTFTFCSQEETTSDINPQEMLEIALFHGLHHFQSESERSLIEQHNIKSVSYTKTIVEQNRIDSTTYLTYNKKGRLTTRTTTECTTVGCLPYIIRQSFVYSNNRIERMDNSTFKQKNKSTLKYWHVADTNKLSRFDWEDYTYNKDTIQVESGSFLWKYVQNQKGNIVYKINEPKTNNQFIETIYEYEDSSIIVSNTNSLSSSTLKIVYQIVDYNKVMFMQTANVDKAVSKEFIFNSKGLLKEILFYGNGKLRSKTQIEYSYFSNT